MLLSNANIVHAMNTAPKPDQNETPEVLFMSSAGKKAAIATAHQGKRNADAKDKISMIRNSISQPPYKSPPEGSIFKFCL